MIFRVIVEILFPRVLLLRDAMGRVGSLVWLSGKIVELMGRVEEKMGEEPHYMYGYTDQARFIATRRFVKF